MDNTKVKIIATKKQLRITNKESRYKLKFGQEFKDMLEPRDHVMEHQFDFTFSFMKSQIERQDYMFKDSSLYQEILTNTKEFLVEAASNIFSASFQLLCKQRITENQAKLFASRNLLLNINSVFRAITEAIRTNIFLCQKIKEKDLQEIKMNLTIEIDNILSDCLVNLADNYPQAPIEGGTPRIRDAIIDLNRMEEEKNDLIFANEIKIDKYIKEGGEDYTEFIMTVINTAIKVTQSPQKDLQGRTTKEIFAQFNQKLFWLCQEKDYESIISQLRKNQRKGQDLIQQEVNSSNYFQSTYKISSTSTQLVQYIDNSFKEIFCPQQFQKDCSHYEAFKINKSPLQQYIQSLKQKVEKGVQEMKKKQYYAIGSKIVSSVKEFTKNELANKEFSAKHSSIQRIITKWSEYLENIFKSPEIHILKRPYPFKTTSNKIVSLRKDEHSALKLIKQLQEEYQKVKKKYRVIVQTSYEYISQLLNRDQKTQGNVNRFSAVRTTASKINAVLIYLMLNYLNLLIHHLLQAGKNIKTSNEDEPLNLVVFRISDLLRSKLQCSESCFINILETMQLLDARESMKGKFKLVRIKNKLDTPANNIIINYLLLGKVQCELQLSLQEPKGKEKNYYTFSHFLYEITRGNFGTIAELAIIISQLDPMITSSQSPYYQEKISKKLIQLRKKESNDKQIKNGQQCGSNVVISRSSYSEKQKLKTEIKKPVIQCPKCGKLIIKEKEIFKEKKLCNRCFMDTANPEQSIQHEKLRSQLLTALNKKLLKRIHNYNEIKQNSQQEQVIAVLTPKKIKLKLVIYIKEELKTFLVGFDEKTLEELSKNTFQFSSLDYINITERKNDTKDSILSEPTYLVLKVQQIFTLLNIPEFLFKNLKDLAQMFQDFRVEKELIKTIKFKGNIINANENEQKWKKLGDITQIFSYSKRKYQLKYTKYNNLQSTSIKHLYGKSNNLSLIPKWLKKYKNLKTLDLGTNSLQIVHQDSLPENITVLNMNENKLTSINVSFLTGLTHLELQTNRLQKIDVSSLKNLTYLNLRQNNIMDMMEIKCSFINLKTLILNSNKLTSFCLKYPPNLEILDLSSNKLAQVTLQNLSHLQVLLLDKNKLKSLNLSSFLNLITLSVDENELNNLTLKNLTLLKQLSANSNQLNLFTSEGLLSLESLKLNCNKFEMINGKKIPSLKRLFLEKNLFEEIKLSSCSSLEELYLNENSIRKVQLGELTNLRTLNLDKNQIQEWSQCNFPTNLRNLSLSSNKFKTIEIDNLHFLDKLKLNNNKNLSRLNIKCHKTLARLDIKGCMILHELSSSLKELAEESETQTIEDDLQGRQSSPKKKVEDYEC